MAVGRLERAGLYTEEARNRGSDLPLIKPFSLDFARLQHVGG